MAFDAPLELVGRLSYQNVEMHSRIISASAMYCDAIRCGSQELPHMRCKQYNLGLLA